jgi:hypothetical protein
MPGIRTSSRTRSGVVRSLHESQRVLAAAGRLHRVALLAEVLAEDLAHRLLVVDDQDAAEADGRH